MSPNFKKGERVSVEESPGDFRDGVVKRTFRSGAYTVTLDRPTERGRDTHAEARQVSEARQDTLPGERAWAGIR